MQQNNSWNSINVDASLTSANILYYNYNYVYIYKPTISKSNCNIYILPVYAIMHI